MKLSKWLRGCALLGLFVALNGVPVFGADETVGSNGSAGLWAVDGWDWAHNSSKTTHYIVPKWKACCLNCNCTPEQDCGVQLQEVKWQIQYKSVVGGTPLYIWGPVHTDSFDPVCTACGEWTGTTHNDSTVTGRKPVKLRVLSAKVVCICCDGEDRIEQDIYEFDHDTDDDGEPDTGTLPPTFDFEEPNTGSHDGDVGLNDQGNV